jgi:multicomponent Na+:H+ antiporter subunit E
MRYLVYFLLCFFTWMLLTSRVYLQNIFVGAAASLLTTLIFGRYFVQGTRKFFQPARYAWLALYIIFLIWECIKANFDVAYRVLHPAMPIRPGIVRIKLNIKSEFGKAMLANSITMTPGTISVDIINDELFVHWIFVTSSNVEEYSYEISGKFEKLLIKIFD